MKNRIFFTALFLFTLICNPCAQAKSPIWKISKNGHHLFLGGTIHLLSSSDYPLPAAFAKAYKNSELLVLETDLQKFSSPEFQLAVIQNTMYRGEKNISQFLTPATLQALESHLTSRGLPMAQMLKFKSGMLSITLTVIELQRLGLVGTGVDEFYSLQAINDKREIKHLETVNEQIDFLAKMGEGNENELIAHTLRDLKTLPDLFASMKKAWRDGDNGQLERVALDPMKEQFPELYRSLLVTRNNNWLPKIAEMMATEEVELVLFGALHLAGEDGVLAQLQALGYKVENQ
ncbi:MAG: TraB/GumN family protein [Thermodesulfobacteriota bacterium]